MNIKEAFKDVDKMMKMSPEERKEFMDERLEESSKNQFTHEEAVAANKDSIERITNLIEKVNTLYKGRDNLKEDFKKQLAPLESTLEVLKKTRSIITL